MISDTINMSSILLQDVNSIEEENVDLRKRLNFEQERYIKDTKKIMADEKMKRSKLKQKVMKDVIEQQCFKEDVEKELKLKSTLIEKLMNRNKMLELLMKKAVKIM